MHFDLEVKRLKENIIKTINESKLPMTAVFYVIQDIMVLTQNVVAQSISQQEKQEIEAKEKSDVEISSEERK